MEGLQLKIQKTITAGRYVDVFRALKMGSRKEKTYIGAQEVGQDAKNIAIREVKKTIAAHPQIDVRQPIAGDVQLEETGVRRTI